MHSILLVLRTIRLFFTKMTSALTIDTTGKPIYIYTFIEYVYENFRSYIGNNIISLPHAIIVQICNDILVKSNCNIRFSFLFSSDCPHPMHVGTINLFRHRWIQSALSSTRVFIRLSVTGINQSPGRRRTTATVVETLVFIFFPIYFSLTCAHSLSLSLSLSISISTSSECISLFTRVLIRSSPAPPPTVY